MECITEIINDAALVAVAFALGMCGAASACFLLGILIGVVRIALGF